MSAQQANRRRVLRLFSIVAFVAAWQVGSILINDADSLPAPLLVLQLSLIHI